MAEIRNIEEAKAAAEKVIESQKLQTEGRRFEFEKFLNAMQEVNPEMSGFDEVATLLAMPEEHFQVLAPVFLAELEKGLVDVNTRLIMVQAMNLQGMKVDNVREQYLAICEQIDEQMSEVLSNQKRDFLKGMLGITYNAMSESEGTSKRSIIIPIEYCNPDAKMPTYAHLTDSGMDVYALEDTTIAPGETKLVPTGIKVAIPAGYELQVRPKSGRCLKTKLRVANTPGTIDAGYRDEIGVIIDNIEPFIKSADIDENGRLYNVEFGSSYTIGKGEKFAQLVLIEVPKAIFYQVEHVSDIANDGRNGGFGSTGVK
jgi:dUTP pyrophosphatase